MDEIIVFLMREYKWSLEYTQNLVLMLPLDKLTALIRETVYQKSIDEYRMASHFAMVIANFGSTKQKKLKVTDIIGQPPKRQVKPERLFEAAERQGIKLPKGGIDARRQRVVTVR